MTSLTKSKLLMCVIAFGGVLVVGGLDFITGTEIRIFPLYFVPVALAAWRVSRFAAATISISSATSWLISNMLAGRAYLSPYAWPINFGTMLVAFGVVGVLVAELRARLLFEQQLSREDPLTALPNRRGFYERAELLLAVGRRSNRPTTLAFLDLDHFKQINDTLGHHVGDQVLVTAAKVLQQHRRAGDVAGRLGGDEFALLLVDTDVHEARIALERIRGVIDSEMRRHDWTVTVTVGAVTFAGGIPPLVEALRNADAVMYAVKKEGRNRVFVEKVAPASSDG